MGEQIDGKKKHFQDHFSSEEAVDFWEKVYKKKDIGGESVKRRMEQTLRWFDRLALPKDSRVLDAGSGAGIVTQKIMSRGYEVFAIDYSLGMLKKTKDRCRSDGGRDVGLAKADVEAIPLKDSSVNFAVSLGVLSYVSTIEPALREFARVLKPGGTLVFSTMNKVNIVGYFDIPVMIRNISRKIWKKTKKATKAGPGGAASSKRLFFTPKVMKSLRELGFEGIECKTIPYRFLTFNGRDIPPLGLNLKIVLLLEKMPDLPVIGPMGGVCLFKAKKKEANIGS